MKFAICNETFEHWPFDRAFALAAECGYTGLEIAPFTINTDARQITSAQRTEVRRDAERAGLDILGLHWLLAKTTGFHLTSADSAVRRSTAEYLAELARLCRDLGGSIMVFGSPQQRNLQPGVTLDQAFQFAADVFQQAMPTLEACDVTLAVEPLSPVLTDFMQTAVEGVRLIETIGSPHCRLHLDCIAMATEDTPIPELIHRHRALLAHFHANDPNKFGPGFGELDFHPIFTALGEIDYRGWVSVEVFDLAPGVERIARESIGYMRQVLDDLAEQEPLVAKPSKKKSAPDRDHDNERVIAQNRRARHEYEVLDTLECGIMLVGSEVKSLRGGKISIEEAYGRVKGAEVWLTGCDIPEYVQANQFNHQPKRPRKLLMHRREIKKFASRAFEQGLTLVPLKMYFKEGRAKVLMGICRGKKTYDKRESLKKASMKREIDRALRRR